MAGRKVACHLFKYTTQVPKKSEMIRHILFYIALLFHFFCSASVKAQDLLITNKYDTLNCRLEKLRNDHYPITFVVGDEKIKGYIHKDSVVFFKKKVFRGLDDNRFRTWYPTFEIGFDAGVVYQFGKFRIDDDLTNKTDFFARTGLFFGTDLTYYFSNRIGYGLKYNYRSLLDGDIQYHYFGPLMAFRFLERKQSNHFFFNFSGGIGSMVQKNAPIQLILIRPRITMKAHSFSGTIAAGYQFKISDRVSFRLQASCNLGYPGFVKIENLSSYAKPSDVPLAIDDYCHNMNTVNFTAGFAFH